MKSQKRWMKSVIATSQSDLPALPWARKKSFNSSIAQQPQRRSA
ncbi:hypothetical protein [Thalassovita sp.]|nr:hypothetical protein [Thalassovita sp.]